MKTTLTLIALALACSGCKTVAPLLNDAVRNMSVSDMQNAAAKAQKISEGQRDFTQAEEVALGSGIASNMLGAAPLWQDKKAQRYVNQVGRVLVAHSERTDLNWHFAVLDDMDFNAFAAPGGYIFVTRGLLQSLRSEAELAGVLAHEIAHVVRKHHLMAIKKASNREVLGDVVNTGTALAVRNNKYSSALTPALSKLASVGTEMYARGLDKEDEYEADRMAVVLAARAGYDPYGLPAVLQSLQTVNPNYAGLALMFKTHPTFQARLDLLGKVMTSDFDKFEKNQTLEARFKSQVAAPKSGK